MIKRTVPLIGLGLLLAACNGTQSSSVPTSQRPEIGATAHAPFLLDLRQKVRTQMHAQATNDSSAYALTPEEEAQLETEPYVSVTLTTGEVVEYKNRDGYAVANEDELISVSSTVGDLISSYQVGAYEGRFVVDPGAPSTDPVVQPNSTSVSTMGAGITPASCSFYFLICWREKVNERRWPNRTVPYSYDASVTSAQRSAINNAIYSWNQNVNNVKFNYNPSVNNRVTFKTMIFSEPGVRGASSVGRSSQSSEQFVLYNPNIFGTSIERGVLHHEMAHAAGMIHEHQRCDRANYITVNITGDSYQTQCASSYKTYTPYDYSSVMHYGPAFSEFQPRTPKPSNSVGSPSDIGQRRGLSMYDIQALNSIYR
ncbi:M12 family metallopeptidase [Deinococcus sp. JMULE3]|uniref:M12 family metallopeptidase n=1 Tax=Deinococcus sp. JMULE3 TaxID=2518341 RepID=UPI00157533D0|nr:M12 family metallopeptidase [Deinococcus sp. JMULE3]NTY02039.1 hypothetical protein [Deinococcus sp. JMULE3]